MEDIKVIERFLAPRNTGFGNGYGNGYGNGFGYGYGNGFGNGVGYGFGSGYGNGVGYGFGSGFGSGYSNGLKEYNGEMVWYVDDVPTLIDRVMGDYARGRIVNSDLTTTPCFIARADNYFAHGETLHKARRDAVAKAIERMPLKDRLAKFRDDFPTLQTKAKCSIFYDWHHIITGSCTMGRDEFIREHSLDMDKEYTVEFFLDIVANSYGKEEIKQLKELYESKKKDNVWKFILKDKRQEVYEYLKTLSKEDTDKWYQEKIKELDN